ncbi:hypothetical protein HDU80_002640, partial [Chytriomyces hyalinus]
LSSASLNMQVSGMYVDPEKTAFDVFCKFLKAKPKLQSWISGRNNGRSGQQDRSSNHGLGQ